jgi:hypothetical protein
MPSRVTVWDRPLKYQVGGEIPQQLGTARKHAMPLEVAVGAARLDARG